MFCGAMPFLKGKVFGSVSAFRCQKLWVEGSNLVLATRGTFTEQENQSSWFLLLKLAGNISAR